jgi:hypothetical protein
MKNRNHLTHLVNKIIQEEELLTSETCSEQSLLHVVKNANGLRNFSGAFYFIRYDFCCLNFVIGERCHQDERLWGGLAKNLMEELGGNGGRSHNQLYRDFLACVDAGSEQSLQCPSFAHEFNKNWREFAKSAPLMEALSAIAIYEIFDVPDYQLLLRVLEQAGVPEEGLHFFRVHANAHHFEMFEDTVTWLMEQEGGEEAFARAREFVFTTQRKMWQGLIADLQAKSTQYSLV